MVKGCLLVPLLSSFILSAIYLPWLVHPSVCIHETSLKICSPRFLPDRGGCSWLDGRSQACGQVQGDVCPFGLCLSCMLSCNGYSCTLGISFAHSVKKSRNIETSVYLFLWKTAWDVFHRFLIDIPPPAARCIYLLIFPGRSPSHLPTFAAGPSDSLCRGITPSTFRFVVQCSVSMASSVQPFSILILCPDSSSSQSCS